jgi:hypothetical protein
MRQFRTCDDNRSPNYLFENLCGIGTSGSFRKRTDAVLGRSRGGFGSHHAEACGDDRPTRDDGKRTELGTASVFAVLSIPKTPSVLIRYRITNLSGDDRNVLPLPGPART